MRESYLPGAYQIGDVQAPPRHGEEITETEVVYLPGKLTPVVRPGQDHK